MKAFERSFLAALLLMALASAARAQPLTECRVPGIRNSVMCGVARRALDPARPDGVKIDVHYVVVPAMARRKWPDPVFMLAGGPGQSAIALAPSVLPLFSRLNNRRDIVFVDQRGTGKSAPLECEDTRREPWADQADPQRQLERLVECRTRLQKLPYGDLRFFTTTLAMQDLDAVRVQLNVDRINLVGASYGTRAALEYQRQFPRGVRRSVIDGVAPPDMVLPASGSADAQASFNAMMAACENDATCAKAYPALRVDWAALLASLPRPVSVRHPLSGQMQTFTFTRDMLLGSVRGPLYAPALASGLPAAVSEAARGRFEGLVGLSSLLSSRRGSQPASGMHFSVVCAEDLPLLARSSDKPGADFGGEFASLYERACADWPRGSTPLAFYGVPPSATPVLVLSGGLDPVTPPRHGERITQALGPLAQHVVVPNAGHGVMGIGCMRDVVFRFIDAAEDKDATAVDAGCVKSIPRPPAFQPTGWSAEAPK